MASGIIDLGSSGKMSGRITWSSSSNGPQNNSSNVTATLQVRRNDSYGPTTGTFTGSLFIHDEQQDYSVHARVSSDWITLKSFSKTVGHSGDGKGSCHIWGNISGPSGTSMSGSYVEADTWVTLDTIPRYANFIEHWIGATGLNSVTVHWATDAPCDRVQYSLNGGGWTDTASTNYTVGGLAPSTRYTIKSRTRRTDSQLWNESGTLTFTTRSISVVQSWTQLTLPAPGTNNTTIKYKISNDSGNATYVYLERNNAGDNYGCNSGPTSVTSGDKTLTLSSTAINRIYNEHASVTASYNGDVNKRATSGMQLTARTSGLTNYYNSYGVTFIMTKANCGPTAIKDFTCQEQQADVAALTGCSTSKTYTNGNGLIVLKGYSNVKINVAANPLSVRAGASNKAISINGGEWLTSTSATSKTLAGVTTNNFSITAKDSRDFSLSKSSTGVTLKTYTPVNISSMRIDRGDGVSTTAYLTLAGTYNALNFGAVTNSVTSVKLQIKTKNTAWTATKITGATTGVIDTTKVNEYTITSLLTASNGNIACSAKELKVSGTSGNLLQFVLGTEYDARIIIIDQLTAKSSFSSQVVTKDTSITSGKVLFSAVKNGGVCFGGFYNEAVGGALQALGDIQALGNIQAWRDIKFNDYGVGIYWKEPGFGDQFKIVPQFSGSGDDNYLSIRGAVGDAGTQPELYDLLNITGKSGDMYVKGGSIAPNGFLSYEAGQVGNRTPTGRLVIKKATANDAPNNGVVLEYGAAADWVGQLYIGDNSYQGIYYNGWSNGVRGTWRRLADAPVILYENSPGTTGTVTLSETAANFSHLEIFYNDGTNYGYVEHSTKVTYPNGKKVALFCFAPSSQNDFHLRFTAKAVNINGNTISNVGSYCYAGWIKNSGVDSYLVDELRIVKVLGYR